jgi:protein-S-isoprenylcysteine O-methyltransferase Ste14
VFLVVAPGVVAGLIPWLLTGWQVQHAVRWLQVVGVLLIAGGAAVLLDAFARFVREGVGTPAPVAPTEHLVVGGLYRRVRNPMYLAVGATILGQALLFGSVAVFVELVLFAAAVGAFVHWYEEPTLLRRYGDEYDDYRRAVPAWLPRPARRGRRA